MNSEQQNALSVEQQFTLRTYQDQVKKVSRKDLEDLFVEIVRQKMAQENLFRDMIKRQL